MRDWNELKQWAEGLKDCPEHYDMPAEVVRLVMADLLALMAENERLKNLLCEAADEIENWGAYASQYFQENHNLEWCVEKFRAELRADNED